MQGVESHVKRILIKDVIDVRTGISGSAVLKKYLLPKEVDNFVLSIITRTRSLDLKANDSATRNRWVKYFNVCIQSRSLRRPSGKHENYEQLSQVDSAETDRQHTVSRRFQYYMDRLGLTRPSELPLEEIWE
jgi:hypothetical protein